MYSANDVAKARKERRMNQQELAKRSGLSPSLISGIENGTRRVTKATQEQLELAFKQVTPYGSATQTRIADLSDAEILLQWHGHQLNAYETQLVRVLTKTMIDQRK